jgi:hypothetical protein
MIRVNTQTHEKSEQLRGSPASGPLWGTEGSGVLTSPDPPRGRPFGGFVVQYILGGMERLVIVLQFQVLTIGKELSIF